MESTEADSLEPNYNADLDLDSSDSTETSV